MREEQLERVCGREREREKEKKEKEEEEEEERKGDIDRYTQRAQETQFGTRGPPSLD